MASKWIGTAHPTVSERDGSKGKPYLRLAVAQITTVDGIDIQEAARTFALNAIPEVKVNGVAHYSPDVCRAMGAALIAYADKVTAGQGQAIPAARTNAPAAPAPAAPQASLPTV